MGERSFLVLDLGQFLSVLSHLLPTGYGPPQVLTRAARFAWLLEEPMVKKDCEVG